MLRINQIKRINPIIVPKVWGFEEVIHNDEDYCFKNLHLRQGFQCSVHYHKIKKETFYLLEGKIVIQLIRTKFLMLKHDHVTIVPGTLHRFIGLEDSIIQEVSTQDFTFDSYRIEGQLSGHVDISKFQG